MHVENAIRKCCSRMEQNVQNVTTLLQTIAQGNIILRILITDFSSDIY